MRSRISSPASGPTPGTGAASRSRSAPNGRTPSSWRSLSPRTVQATKSPRSPSRPGPGIAWFTDDMARFVLLLCALLVSGCGADTAERSVPSGTFHGLGDNTLTLHDPAWSLRSGTVLWSGTYRIESDRLILRTEEVDPLATHGSDCLDEEETYRWSWEGEALRLSFDGTPC